MAIDWLGAAGQRAGWSTAVASLGATSGTTWRRSGATLLALSLSAAVLWWLLSETLLTAFAEAMLRAQLWQLAVAWMLIPAIQSLRAWRFSLLTSGRLEVRSWPMYVIATRLLLFNYLLPFKLGEVSFPLMMKRAFGTDYARSTGVLVAARLMDLCVVSAMLVFGVVLVIDPAIHDWDLRLLIGAGLAILVLPLVGIELLGALWRAGGRLRRLAPSVDGLLWRAAASHPLPQRGLALALTVAIWIANAILAYLAASAVAGGFGFFHVMLSSAAANLAFALPVSGFAGLGPPQAAWATGMHLTGLPWSPAIVTALICHGVLLTGALGLGVATFLLSTWQPVLRRRLGFAASGRSARPAPGHPALGPAVLGNAARAQRVGTGASPR